jgi:hypothetical protein
MECGNLFPLSARELLVPRTRGGGRAVLAFGFGRVWRLSWDDWDE